MIILVLYPYVQAPSYSGRSIPSHHVFCSDFVYNFPFRYPDSVYLLTRLSNDLPPSRVYFCLFVSLCALCIVRTV